jgi:riboflavin kinase/FMN adenylyltransferase
LLAAGDVAGANAQLGRCYELRGPVIDGDHRGRELGFPTANVAVPARMCLPADGIYAGTLVDAEGVERPAAVSLGRRPTFYEHAEMSLLEAYVLDWSGDLYGQQVKVRFAARLRGEERFDTVEDLVVQMNKDVQETRRLLG